MINLIHGVGQGHGAASITWEAVSTLLLNIQRKEGYVSNSVNSELQEASHIVRYAYVYDINFIHNSIHKEEILRNVVGKCCTYARLD